MTSVQNRARLLIISNSIYARRSDGSLCPGTIQTRHSDVYIVKFDDGAVERVLEDKLTWIGFGGMPPQIWPKTPVIHPTSSWETFRDRTMPHRDSDRRLKEQKFGSFNEQRVYESMSSELPSETHNTHFQSSKADTNIPSHLLPKQIDSNQPRSSVLRISSNVLSKEGNLSDFLNFSDPVQDELISVDKSLHNPSHDEKHSKDNRSDFETQFASLATEKSRQTTDTHEAFQGHLDYDWPLQQVMCKYSLDRGGSSSALDVGASYASQEEEEEELRMADAELEYYKKKFRRFSALDCSPSVNPSHFISSPLPFFSPPFEIDFLNVSAPAMPSSFRLHPKTKKKIEKKKCRKVYGIENRQFWCRQCRWKKACTRFKTANKITTNGFA